MMKNKLFLLLGICFFVLFNCTYISVSADTWHAGVPKSIKGFYGTDPRKNYTLVDPSGIVAIGNDTRNISAEKVSYKRSSKNIFIIKSNHIESLSFKNPIKAPMYLKIKSIRKNKQKGIRMKYFIKGKWEKFGKPVFKSRIPGCFD